METNVYSDVNEVVGNNNANSITGYQISVEEVYGACIVPSNTGWSEVGACWIRRQRRRCEQKACDYKGRGS